MPHLVSIWLFVHRLSSGNQNISKLEVKMGRNSGNNCRKIIDLDLDILRYTYTPHLHVTSIRLFVSTLLSRNQFGRTHGQTDARTYGRTIPITIVLFRRIWVGGQIEGVAPISECRFRLIWDWFVYYNRGTDNTILRTVFVWIWVDFKLSF